MKAQIRHLMDQFRPFGFTVHSYPNAIGLWKNEQESLLWMALNADPNTNWIEIGSFCGGSAVLLCLAKKFNGGGPSVYCVDRAFEGIFDRNMANFGDMVRKLQIDSLDLSKHYEGGPVGLAFIDGWHSFKGALLDFEIIEPWLAPGAYVAFHDGGQQPLSQAHLDRCYQEALARYDEWMAEELPNPRTQEQTYNIDHVAVWVARKYGYSFVEIPVLDKSTNCLVILRKPQ